MRAYCDAPAHQIKSNAKCILNSQALALGGASADEQFVVLFSLKAFGYRKYVMEDEDKSED